MSDAMGLDVICEGVETEAQAAKLTDLGCTLAQGFLYGRPAPMRERLVRAGANTKKPTNKRRTPSNRTPE